MLVCGARNADLQGLGDFIINPNSDELVVDVIISKTRKCPDHRYTLVLRGDRNVFQLLPASIQADLLTWCQCGNKVTLTPGGRPYVKTGNLLRWISMHCPSITSYTIRRNYIHRIISFFRAPDSGVVDWKAVSDMTLHFSEVMVKGVYAASAAQMAHTDI